MTPRRAMFRLLPLLLALAAALSARTRQGGDFPTPEHPWKAGECGRERDDAEAFTQVWQKSPLKAWRAHPGAAVYPGVPPRGSRRIAERILPIDLGVPRWHSTGLFAAAGEPVTVVIPPGVRGLRLRIGTTSCNLLRLGEWWRMPRVDVEVPLEKPETTVSSPFGGLVYLVVPPGRSGRIQVAIRNACPAVWFVAGRDSPRDWRRMLAECQAPQGEIQGARVILTVPRAALAQVKDPLALAKFWDGVADLDARLADLPMARPAPERYCCDVQLCAGYMHSGYPLMVPVSTAPQLVDVKHLRAEGDWGFFHEMGHNHQNPDWTFDGTGEVTVNFFTLYVLDKLCGIPPRKSRTTRQKGRELIARWKRNGQTFDEWKREPFLALELFVRLHDHYGWTPFERMFREYRRLPPRERPQDDDARRDQWAVRFSRQVNADIGAVFAAWKIPLSPAARKACAKYSPAPGDICAGVR